MSYNVLDFGPMEKDNFGPIIVPEGLDTSLLGQSYLSTVQPVRIEHDKMVLGE